MEGVAALSVAANVIQVVSFTHKVLSAVSETYKTGHLSNNAGLEQIALDLKAANESLQQKLNENSGSSLSRDNQVRHDLSPNLSMCPKN